MFISKKTSLVFLILLSACTRPPQSKFTEKPIVYELQSHDQALKIDGIKKVQVDEPKGVVHSADLFQYYSLSQGWGEIPDFKSSAQNARTSFLDFYRAPGTHSVVAFQNSPYVDFFIAKSKPAFMKATEDLDQFFAKQKKGVDSALAIAQAPLSQLPEAISLSVAIQKISEFMGAFEAALQQSDIDASVRNGILGGLYQRFWLKLPATTEIVQSMENAKSFNGAVESLRSLVSKLDISLTQEQEDKLRSANEIGQMLSNEEMDPQAAFTVLLEIWDRMTVEERKETFGEMSPELYAFLNTQRREHRECLKREDCNSLVLSFAKKFLILPNVKKYGVEKLRAQIQASAIDQLKTQTGTMATDLVRELPQSLREEIFRELDAEYERYAGYRKNYESFIRSETQHWFERRFLQTSLPALEADRIQITAAAKNNLQVTGIENSGGLTTSANSLGAAMAVPFADQFSAQNKDRWQLLALTRVNQLLAHGGFLKHDGGSFPSLSRALFPSLRAQPLNIEKSLELPGVFVMPTPARVTSGFDFSTRSVPSDLSVLGQAHLLRGFTQMIHVFRDWQKTSMDQLLGHVQAKDLLPSLPADGLDVAAFPKEALLAMAVGNASAILSNLKTKGSPLFIYCSDRSLAWFENDFKCKAPSALAGLVDLKNYRKQNQVDTAAHAQYLESLLYFISTAEELNKTKSEYLTKSTLGQLSGLEQLQKALPDLRGLAIGMTNFLTHHLQSEDGGFYASYDLQNNRVVPGWADLNTQLLAMRAVMKSVDYFNLTPYRMSVVSNYYFLNRVFWDDSTGFYRPTHQGRGRGRATSLDLALAVSVLEQLKNYPMAESSQAQWQSLMTLWRQALKTR